MALQYVDKVKKDLDITKELEAHPRQVKAHVEAQIQELKAVLNRLILDAARAEEAIATAKDETTRGAHVSKLNTFHSDIRQFAGTLRFFLELDSELEVKE